MVGKKLKLRKPVEGKDNAPKTEQKTETATALIADAAAPAKETPSVPQDPESVTPDKPADGAGAPEVYTNTGPARIRWGPEPWW